MKRYDDPFSAQIAAAQELNASAKALNRHIGDMQHTYNDMMSRLNRLHVHRELLAETGVKSWDHPDTIAAYLERLKPLGIYIQVDHLTGNILNLIIGGSKIDTDNIKVDIDVVQYLGPNTLRIRSGRTDEEE